MNKIVAYFLCALFCLALPGCAPEPQQEEGKLLVTATLFPQFDFARQILKDRGDVRLLLPPGVESHSYEPTPADMIAIEHSALFLFTGKYMEPWAQTVADGISDSRVRILDVSEGIVLDAEEHDEHESDEHHHEYDPHIWTSPGNAVKMAENIAEAVIAADPGHAEEYRENLLELTNELNALDASFREAVSEGSRRELVFGSRFALHYFARDYGLSYDAAFDACSEEAEPSVNALIRLTRKIRREGIPVVYYEELTDPKVARTLAEETGTEMLLFHSCHNVSKKELAEGVTYVSLMRQNVENLKRGLA